MNPLDQTDPSPRPRPSRLTRRAWLGAAATTGAALAIVWAPTATAADRSRVELPAGLQPEGITSGPGSTFYVGSLADGRILTGDLLSGGTRVLLPGAAGRQIRGLRWDPRSGLVWAAGNVGEVAHVWAVQAGSGAVVLDTVVPGGGFLNDLVVAEREVWVTDSYVDRLTRIPLAADATPTGATPGSLALGGDWPVGDGEVINANGVRLLPDGTPVLNNSRVGGLWQVDPADGVVTEVEVLGGPGLSAGDGLELRGRTLFDVRGSGQAEVSVLRLRARAGGGTWSARWVGALTDPDLDVPATATAAVGALWAVNARFGVTDPAAAAYWVTRLPLRP